MSMERARSALKSRTAGKVAPSEEPPTSSPAPAPAPAPTRTSSRRRRAPLPFGEQVNNRTASSSSSAVESSVSKPFASGSTTFTSRAPAKKKTAALPPPSVIIRDKENDPLPTSRRRAPTLLQQRQLRQPSVDSLAELEASYIVDDSRVSTAAIPPDSSLVRTADVPAHSTPIASPGVPLAVATKATKGKRTPFRSLLDDEMLSESEGEHQLKFAKHLDSEEDKTRRQLTENKLERVRSFVGSSRQHRGSSLAPPPPIEDYKETDRQGIRSKTARTWQEDEEDEFGFFNVLKRSAADRAQQPREAVPPPPTEQVQITRQPTLSHDEEQDEGSSSLGSLHLARPASQVSSHPDQDSLQALLRSSPSDLVRPPSPAEKDDEASSNHSMDTDDYLYAPQVPRGDKKKARKKPRRPNPLKGRRPADAQDGEAKQGEANGKGKGKGKADVPPTQRAVSKGSTGSSVQDPKQAPQSKTKPKKKTKVQLTPPSPSELTSGEGEEEVAAPARQDSQPSLSPAPELVAGTKRSRRSAQNSKSAPAPLTAAAKAAKVKVGTPSANPLGTSAAGNVAKGKTQASGTKSKAALENKDEDGTPAAAGAASTSWKRQAPSARGTRGGKARAGENGLEEQDEGEEDENVPLKTKAREKRLKMYDELDDYHLGEEWVI